MVGVRLSFVRRRDISIPDRLFWLSLVNLSLYLHQRSHDSHIFIMLLLDFKLSGYRQFVGVLDRWRACARDLCLKVS
jgi:uncharacterized membrane protein